MSCPHGNHPDACDICDEVAAAYNSGVEHTKREWVGLTEEEVIAVFKERDGLKFARAIEAALKVKNT
jgi:hypothetical protein